MRRALSRGLALPVVLAGGVLLIGLTPTASADLAWKECAGAASYACARLAVPLDRSGRVPGTVSLSIRRRRAPVGNGSVAVFALAGGPGQGAIQLTDGLAQALGPALATRDLIVFDQRGTGESGALKCRALSGANNSLDPPARAVAACADQIGAGHGDYTTADSVADLEAVRAAAGYDKIVLYGTSYGTKVALDYARAYPTHVQALLLDSVVTPDGPDVFSRSTIQAVPRVLRQMCASRLCAHVTSTPTADVAALARRLRVHALRASVVDGHGRAHRVLVTEHDLLDILVDGDLDPTLRPDYPAAVRSALEGDPAPLARLRHRAAASEGSEGVDVPLFYSTYCEEIPFPWSRGAAPGARLTQLQSTLQAIPAASFAPFDRRVSLFESGALQCFDWPFASAAPQTGGPPLPNVPTLILSGADDLRTPTADALSVAAQIPDARVEVVPFTGHSVLGSDPGKCANDAVQAFFAGRAVKPCRGERLPSLERPTAVAPAHLRSVRRYPGVPGRAGRTATAVVLTLDDLDRQLVDNLGGLSGLAAVAQLNVGGLRAGYASFGANDVRLHGLTYVPGVAVSGTLTARHVTLHVGGAAAAAGELTAGSGGTLHGFLGGVRVRISGRQSASALGASASIARVAPRTQIPRIP